MKLRNLFAIVLIVLCMVCLTGCYDGPSYDNRSSGGAIMDNRNASQQAMDWLNQFDTTP